MKCPLKFKDGSPEMDQYADYCEEEECAWWIMFYPNYVAQKRLKGCCVIVAIANRA